MKIDGLFDIVLLVLVCVLGLTITASSLGLIKETSSITQTEKAALVSINDNTPTKPEFNASDAILMLVVQDPYMQYPTTVQVNEQPYIEFNEDWFTNREAQINKLWTSYLRDAKDKDVTAFYTTYTGGQYRWKLMLN